LDSAAKRLARIKEVMAAGDDDDGLLAKICVPLLKRAIEDAQTLLARMKG
jgi:hypothetical protein